MPGDKSKFYAEARTPTKGNRLQDAECMLTNVGCTLSIKTIE